jgi:hypothetical protein
MSGVLAPSSSWRAAVVALGRGNGVVPESRSTTKERSKKKKERAAPTILAETSGVPSAARSEVPPEGPRAAATSLGDGVVRPVFARIDWASLLKRVYLEDVLACPCGGRRRVIGDITQPEVITAILRPSSCPPRRLPSRGRATQRSSRRRRARAGAGARCDGMPREGERVPAWSGSCARGRGAPPGRSLDAGAEVAGGRVAARDGPCSS